MPKSDLPMSRRNWPRYARALDMHLAGHKLDDIAHELGVTRERAADGHRRQAATRVPRIPRTRPPAAGGRDHA
jgi:hypothetical protein